MSTLYGSLLPRELLLELSLYLPYRDVWQLCEFYENICYFADLWIHKINKELGYSIDFIKQYVYDSTTKEIKTLLPINEKYIELKSRNSIDFGSEYYKNKDILIYRVSRVRDFQLARVLIDYYFNMYEFRGIEYHFIVEGTISVGNLDLTYDMINRLKSFYSEINDDFTKDILGRDIIQGYHEAPKSIRNKIDLGQFNITANDIEKRKREVVLGLTAGNHLEELKAYDTYIRTKYDLLAGMAQVAAMSGAEDVIKYYRLLEVPNRDLVIRRAIDYGNIIADSQVSFIDNGYLEYIDFEGLDGIQPAELRVAFMTALYFNHIDTTNALYIHDTEFYGTNVLKYSPYRHLTNIIPETYEFIKRLYPYFEFPQDQLESIKRSANKDLIQYLIEKGIISK